MDVAAQVPHAAVRAYVMGDRAHEDATADEVAAMAVPSVTALPPERSASRPPEPSCTAPCTASSLGRPRPADELLAIGEALGETGHGVFEVVTDQPELEAERSWMIELSRRTGARVTYGLAQTPFNPLGYRGRPRRRRDPRRRRGPDHAASRLPPDRHALRVPVLATPVHHPPRLPGRGRSAPRRSGGCDVVAGVAAPACLPRAQRPPTSSPAPSCPAGSRCSRSVTRLTTSRHAVVERRRRSRAGGPITRGRRARLDARFDGGTALLFAPLASYVDRDHEAIREMITHPSTILGLSDGGAHCGLICDASMPTYLLTHWVRDRSRGERLSLEARRRPPDRSHGGGVRPQRPGHRRRRQACRSQHRSTSTA